jgi:hypothetical protein
MQRYRVALLLRKRVDEISDMTVDEFNGWIAFIEILKNEPGAGFGR